MKPTQTRYKRWLIAAAVVAAAIILARFYGKPAVQTLVETTASMGDYAPFVYAAAAALAIAAFLPASVVFLGAGVLFGIGQGVLVAFAGAVAGSSVAFGVARALGRPRVQPFLDRHRHLRRIDAAVSRKGSRTIWLLRLSPVVPLWFLNISLGASRMRARFFLMSMIASLPAVFLYVYTGHTARQVLYGGEAGPRSPWEWALLVVGLLATAAAVVSVGRAATQALDDEVQDSPEPLEADGPASGPAGQNSSDRFAQPGTGCTLGGGVDSEPRRRRTAARISH